MIKKFYKKKRALEYTIKLNKKGIAWEYVEWYNPKMKKRKTVYTVRIKDEDEEE